MSYIKGQSILVNNLILNGYHGVLDQEKVVGNIFSYTLRVDTVFNRDVENDDLNATINYVKLVDIIKYNNSIASELLENVAYRIVEGVRQLSPMITGGMVKVSKIAPPIPGIELDDISVILEF